MRIFTFFVIVIFLPTVVFAQRRARRVAPATDSAVTIPLTDTVTPPQEFGSPRSGLTRNARKTGASKPASAKPIVSKKSAAEQKVVSQKPIAEIKSLKVFSPRATTVLHKLGDDHIQIKIFHYGDAKEPFFINLHDDEATAVSGAKRMLENYGGILVKIVNGGQRNIQFKLNKKPYTFDPNRIFSRTGIIQTLNMFGNAADGKVIDELEKFGARILQLLPSSPSCIIALHNNSDGKFSITSYMVGREREKDAKAVSARPNEDPDDLFLTTDSVLFYKLRREQFNVVLQDNTNAFKDGSLSIYCGEKKICYLNCETEHGKLSQYWEMISSAIKHLKKPVSETIVYNYRLSPNRDSIRLLKTHDIYFGEKKIGTTRLMNAQGQLEVTKSFPLYDNMDLVYFKLRKEEPKIELKVDPTRSSSIHDPEKDVIVIKVVP
jgi:hypothetical protein